MAGKEGIEPVSMRGFGGLLHTICSSPNPVYGQRPVTADDQSNSLVIYAEESALFGADGENRTLDYWVETNHVTITPRPL